MSKKFNAKLRSQQWFDNPENPGMTALYIERSLNFGLTPEEKSKLGKKCGTITSAQRWKCLVTGHISTPGGLSNHQKGLGIDYKDKSLRVRITHL